FVPQPNLQLPTTKLVGFKPTFALRPVSPTDSLQVASPLRSPLGSASQSHLYISGWFVGFHASTQPTFIFRCLD
ncbi:hypothetical protein, partial [Cylindrospermopsis raciborskii]|uniref:hypothetical protein n=2 Tax=Cylindrospermopsis raciborskii TaxID=77022 RepID=UPI001CA50ED9